MSEEKFGFLVTKKNPKANAPEYELRTVKEIFAILTPENMNRFFKDFKNGMAIAVHMREAVKAGASCSHPETKEIPTAKIFELDHFDWIDD